MVVGAAVVLASIFLGWFDSRRWLTGDADELDIENEHRVLGNERRASLWAIGEMAGDYQLADASDVHGLDALGPPSDDAIEREGDGLSAVV